MEVRLPRHDQFNYLAGFKDTWSLTLSIDNFDGSMLSRLRARRHQVIRGPVKHQEVYHSHKEIEFWARSPAEVWE